MWVMCIGEYEKRQGVKFKYSRTRKTENAIDMIAEFNGTLISDAYVAYQNIDEVSSAFCWSHVRRYFVNSILLDSKGKEVPGSKGNEGRNYINKFFKIEDNVSFIIILPNKSSIQYFIVYLRTVKYIEIKRIA